MCKDFNVDRNRVHVRLQRSIHALLLRYACRYIFYLVLRSVGTVSSFCSLGVGLSQDNKA